VLGIVSLLSVDTVLYNPPTRRDEVLAARRKFTSSEGDHMTLLNIYRAFKKVSGNKVSLTPRCRKTQNDHQANCTRGPDRLQSQIT
jgi:hypothetical protein